MIICRLLRRGISSITGRVFFCVCLFMLFVGTTTCLGAEIYSADLKEGIDVILLIDVSGSMKASDKSKNALEATKMFIDMLEKKSSRIGIMAFTDSVVGICELQEIKSHSDRERLKAEVDSFEYDGYTDIGLSLKSAVDVMANSIKDANSPMILMLTDGNVEMDEQVNGRTPQHSFEDIVSAITLMGDELPIYTIGLNYNNNVDEQVLTTISNQTNARSYVIKEADILPQIFNEIFADHIKSSLQEVASFVSDGESYTDITIDITSGFVAEANVIMLSTSELIDAELYAPDGSTQSFDQDVITFSQSNKYAIIKILNPGVGQWLLKAKGIKDDTIKINLIYKYDIGMDISISQEDGSKDEFIVAEPIKVVGRFISNGVHTEERELYEASEAMLYVADFRGETVYMEQMKLDGSEFIATYAPKEAGAYRIYIKTTGVDFSTDSAVIDVEIADKPETVYPDAIEEPLPEPETDIRQNEDGEAVPKETQSKSNVAAVLLSFTLAIGILVLIGCYIYVKARGSHCFVGYVEVRAMGEDGVYTSLETPSLNTYANKTTLKAFFNDSLKVNTQTKIKSLPFDIDGITLTQRVNKDSYEVQIDNRSSCRIVNDEGREEDSRIIWTDKQKLIIKGYGENDISKIEMTYRAEEV